MTEQEAIEMALVVIHQCHDTNFVDILHQTINKRYPPYANRDFDAGMHNLCQMLRDNL